MTDQKLRQELGNALKLAGLAENQTTFDLKERLQGIVKAYAAAQEKKQRIAKEQCMETTKRLLKDQDKIIAAKDAEIAALNEKIEMLEVVRAGRYIQIRQIRSEISAMKDENERLREQLGAANERCNQAIQAAADFSESVTKGLREEIGLLKTIDPSLQWLPMSTITPFNDGDQIMACFPSSDIIHCQYREADYGLQNDSFVSVRMDSWSNHERFTRAEISFFLRIVSPLPFTPDSK